MNKIVIPKNNQFDMDLTIEINSDTTRFGFITGAGASVGSGLPTYYGKNGYYTNLSTNPEDILNKHNMRNHPEKIWDAIGKLTKQGLMAQPNITHKKIVELQSIAKDSQVLTQNVDGLHTKAGSHNIVNMHGCAKESYCSSCANEHDFFLVETKTVLSSYKEGSAPICPKCKQAKMVPNIVSFGDNVNEDDYWKVLNFYSKPVDVCFVIGTQVSFQYIEMALYDTREKNKQAIVIDINPDSNHYNPYADFIFHETCDEFFKRLIIK